MSISVEAGRRILLLRKQLGITQEKLALDAGISVSYLRRLEHGMANPTLNTLHRLADALGVSIDCIITVQGRGAPAPDYAWR